MRNSPGAAGSRCRWVEGEPVDHVGKLEAIAAEVVLAVALTLYQLPLVRRLTRQIG